ncbi:uncharacterized protein LOC100181304 [Ciona intestinalis]
MKLQESSLFLIKIAFIYIVPTITGLRCLNCRSSKSLAACYAEGRIEECWQKDHVCYTEVRYEQRKPSSGVYSHTRINAGCKQEAACINNERRNSMNCYHGWVRNPQRCYRCCKNQDCVGERKERKTPPCQEAMLDYFNRFDANEDGLVEAWEADLQSSGRGMKSKSVFASLLNVQNNFRQIGVTLGVFTEAMSAWLEEKKLVADRNGNGKISFWEFYWFLRNEMHMVTKGSIGRKTAEEMFFRMAGPRRQLDLCQFMNIYSNKVSKELTVIRCKEKLYRPSHGTKSCTNSDVTNSVCMFKCNRGYRMIGNETITCARTARWTSKLPRCERIKCFPETISLHGGMITCSNSNYAFSQCRAECNESRGFVMSGEGTKSCRGDGTWSEEQACCSRPCPPYAILDLVLIFDSSSSVGRENWKKLMKFCAEIVGSFTIGRDLMRVGAFRYNQRVDTATEVLLGEIDTFDELKTKVHKIPYNGSGTRTGNALLHAYNYSLNAPGNRPNVRDIVLVFTDGVSHDDVIEPARLLQSRGADINVVGIKNSRGRLDINQMRGMVSKPIDEHITVISQGFESLTLEFVNRISRLVCGNPCQHIIS